MLKVSVIICHVKACVHEQLKRGKMTTKINTVEGGLGGRGRGEYHAMKCQRSVPNENPPPFFCSTPVLRNKEEINTNERAVGSYKFTLFSCER
jgi:hypothetical protein